MTKSFTLCLLILASIFLSFSAPKIQLIEFNPNTLYNSAAKINTTAFRYNQTDYFVIQPKTNSPEYLKSNSLNIESYLGDGYYLVSSASTADKSFQNIQYSKLGYIDAESKIDNTLLAQQGTQAVTVMYAPNISNITLAEIIAQTSIDVIQNNTQNHHFSANVSKQQIQQLAKYPFVYFITKFYPNKTPLMYDAILMTGTNQVQNLQPYGYNLKGEGVNVGVWDIGAVGVSIDLPTNRNFVIDKEYSSSSSMAHPTEVGGCIGGGGNLYAPLRGMAPRSNIYYWDIAGDIVNEILTGQNSYNVNISNHSYSFTACNCFQSGMYIPEAADLDKAVHNNPTMLPVVAVGNTATNNCGSVTDTFSSVDIGFQGCKNAITVGWLFADKRLVENSGRGPTEDGRLKPELTSKGFAVTILYPNNGIGTVWGSSYSAPGVAGIATLLYQKYQQDNGTMPNAALVKAVLFNTARDLGNPGPDYKFGFGIPDANRAASSIANHLFVENSIAQNGFNTNTITVPNNTAHLKVTLSWTDKEGNPAATQSLVNNLDLKVVTPSGDTILPWKLNPSKPRNTALRGIDNVNNNEQVTIDKPQAGNYTIVVKGTSVPYGPQDYAVAYFSQERKIELTHPNGGEILDPGTTTIRWYNNTIDSTSKIEFSPDNGASWQSVVKPQQLSTQIYSWALPSVVSNQCLVKITSGNNVAVSAAPFTIGTQTNYNSISHTVCDKTVKINWGAAPGASSYRVYLFVDTTWTFVAETNLTTYTISNLINGKSYFYSIAAVKNGVEGNHSLSKGFSPQAGACTTTNDVGIYAINNPIGGRLFTSSALSATQKLSFVIKNFGTAAQNTITVSYRINGGIVRTATLARTVNSNDTAIIYFTINENLSSVGNYNVVAWTNLSGDNNSANDTLQFVIRQLANAPVTLPMSESFETINTQQSNAVFGLNGLEYADYYPQNKGMLRSNEGNLYAHTGKRAITLDNYSGAGRARNEMIFTYNLSNYTDSLIYFDFYYMNRGETDTANYIFARGDDTKPWVNIIDLYANRGALGAYQEIQGINLYEILKVENNQSFSSSTQIKIVQSGAKTAYTPYGNGGYTFDDFKLYVAGQDIATINVSTKKVNCSKTISPQPISITVYNNSAQSVTNLPVFYQVGNSAIVAENIPATIAPNDTLTYTFSTLINTTLPGQYLIKAWVKNAGDLYPWNDTLSTSQIVMKTIDSFPYYNDFESNNGNVFAEGENNSWAWGTPQKYTINDAAQGNKAWVTGITKGYNFNEDSYLYMGCMDFSTLTTDPMIAFNFISDMQTLSDSAFAEYSTDGTTWNRLGCYNCGLNWYNGYQNKPHWDITTFPWQVAHTKVPLANINHPENFMYRLRLLSDDYLNADGIGIDDVHVFTNYQDIATSDSVYVSANSTGNGWISFYRNGKIVAELFDNNKNIGNVVLGYEADPNKHKVFDNKNIFPRNWVIKPQNAIVSNYTVRLYVLNTEYTNFILNEDSINRMGDIGMIRYIGLNTDLDISDNHVRAYYKYYTPQDIRFYPFQNGYYVEFQTDTLGEFYLISTKQDANAIQNINIQDFSAQILNDDVYLQWQTSREINSRDFVVQYSFDGITFIDVDTVPAAGFSNALTNYNFLHELNTTSGIYYYRLKMEDNINQVTYSLIDSVYFAPTVGIKQNSTSALSYIANNDIVISMKNTAAMPANISVYNTLGQLQFSKKYVLQNGINPLGISDFMHWPSSPYFLQIQGAEHSFYSKLIKQ